MLQNKLISYVFIPIGKRIDRLSNRTKDEIAILSMISLFILLFLRTSGIVSSFPVIFIVGGIFLILFLSMFLHGKMNAVNFHPILFPLWLSIGVLLLISAVVNSTFEYVPNASIFLLVMPVCFIIIANSEFDRFFTIINKAAIFSFVIYLIWSHVVNNSIGEYNVYSGLMPNQNGTMRFLIIPIVILLIEIITSRKNYPLNIFCYILAGASIASLYYTASRAGFVAFTVALIAIVLVKITDLKKKKYKLLLCKLLGVFFIAFFFIINLFPIYSVGTIWDVEIKYDGDRKEAFKAYSNKVVLDITNEERDPSHSIIDKSIEENGEENMTTQPIDENATNEDGVEEKNVTEGQLALERISTGRTVIWREFINRINLFGNSKDVLPIEIPEDDDVRINSAHNIYLEMIFKGGIFSGVAYLIVTIFCGIKSFGYAIKSNDMRYAIEPLLIALIYGSIGMFDSISFVPFVDMLTMFYYLSLSFFMCRIMPKVKEVATNMTSEE